LGRGGRRPGLLRCSFGLHGAARKATVFAHPDPKCKTAVERAGAPRILRRVDQDIAVERRYRVDACAAPGAFGEVLRATERATGRLVAIKRLHEHLVNAENTTRLLREASLLAAIGSPHVVGCSGWGRDDAGRPCLVLEWVDGQDLGRRRPG